MPATPEVRVARLVEEFQFDESEAKKLVREGDLARADYLRLFYGVKQELPTHYDLVVNTEFLEPEAAADLIARAAGRDGR